MKVKFSKVTIEEYTKLEKEARKGEYLPGSTIEAGINVIKSIPLFILFLLIMKIIMEKCFIQTFLFIEQFMRKYYMHIELGISALMSVFVTMVLFGALTILIAKLFMHGNKKFVTGHHPIRDQEIRYKNLITNLYKLYDAFDLEQALQIISPKELAETDLYRDGNEVHFFIKSNMFIEKRGYRVNDIDNYIKDDILDFSYLDEKWKEIEVLQKEIESNDLMKYYIYRKLYTWWTTD